MGAGSHLTHSNRAHDPKLGACPVSTGTTLTQGTSDRSSQAPAPDAAPLTPSTPQILDLVQRHVPEARLVEELPHELVLALPYAGALDGSFAIVFQELDRQLAALGLAGYGVSDTSLEEVWDLVGFQRMNRSLLMGGKGALQAGRALREGGQLRDGLRRFRGPKGIWGSLL